MKTRFANVNDKNNIEKLWKYCFHKDSYEFTSYYLNKRMKLENTLVVEENNNILSSLQLNPYKLSFFNNIFKTSYIVGVSTPPEYRGKGIMKKLFSDTFEVLKEKKEILSILMPIDPRLYSYFGYENVFDILECNTTCNSLISFKTNRFLKNIDSLKNPIPILINLYNSFIESKYGLKKDFYIKRDEFYFSNWIEEIKSENGNILFSFENEVASGYIVYYLLENEIFVREIVSSTIDDLKTFSTLLKNHFTQVENIKFLIPIDFSLEPIIQDPNKLKITKKPFMMARIIDVEAFLKALDFSNLKEEIIFKILDPFIKENQACFKISFNKIEKVNKNPLFEINIQDFTALSLGKKSFKSLLYEEKIKFLSDDINFECLNSLFKKTLSYINDYV